MSMYPLLFFSVYLYFSYSNVELPVTRLHSNCYDLIPRTYDLAHNLISKSVLLLKLKREEKILFSSSFYYFFIGIIRVSYGEEKKVVYMESTQPPSIGILIYTRFLVRVPSHFLTILTSHANLSMYIRMFIHRSRFLSFFFFFVIFTFVSFTFPFIFFSSSSSFYSVSFSRRTLISDTQYEIFFFSLMLSILKLRLTSTLN